ncbi:MAG: cytochrome C [Nitrospirae bacterium]|nr:cytochrome C [Nitrospirota bacterium]
MDHDYSVFAILPPYNNLHAQLMDKFTGKLVNSGVTITYEATKDTNGSINSTSIGKTNFWDWVVALFGVSMSPDVGLAGNPVQSLTPAKMTYDTANGYWKADGVPSTPYDDNGNANYYPMVKVIAKDRYGRILATTRTVLPVSDEMTCVHCHASGDGDPMAQPSPDWVYDPDPGKDWKRNILLLHDNKNINNATYQQALQNKGYSADGLLATSDSGKPILCAGCHSSNALGTPGFTGVKPLTEAIHSWHGTMAMDDNTGMPMDQTTDRSVCYYCHPGSTTQCLRGVMGTAKDPDGNPLLQCTSCHGSMCNVGAPGRAGWTDLPRCQNCHYWSDATRSYVRDTSVFDQSGNFRQTASIFSSGTNLYKVGSGAGGHGNVQCEACHGSTHAEYTTSEPNDNVQSLRIQGHTGTISECSACHIRPLPVTSNGGPHGLHTIGQMWVRTHGLFAKKDLSHCNQCHGSDLKGTPLSKAFTRRTLFSYGKYKIFAQGHAVSCDDCHYGKRRLKL